MMNRLRLVFAALLLLLVPGTSWGWGHASAQTLADVPWVYLSVPPLHLYALPRTYAAEHLPDLAREAQASLERIAMRLDMPVTTSLDIYFVERIFWQGGVAYGSDVFISWPARNYLRIPIAAYLDHELTHALTAPLVSDGSEINALLAEGLAVWATGGHYGVEPIHHIAAALARSPTYVSIPDLATNLYAYQHEVAYIEAGSFVGYLVETYGLDTVKRLYADANAPERILRRTYPQLERDWLAWLRTIPNDPAIARWFDLRVRIFDAMRTYQETFDPLARELPPPPDEWAPSYVAMYAHATEDPFAIVLETMLADINTAHRCGNLDDAEAMLRRLDRAMRAGAPTDAELSARLATLLAVQNARRWVQGPMRDAPPSPAVARWAPLLAIAERTASRLTITDLDTITPLHATATLLVEKRWSDTSLVLQWQAKRQGTTWSITAIMEQTQRSRSVCTKLPIASTTIPPSKTSILGLSKPMTALSW
nr:hypothetical protein [Ardenticatena sp.]